MKTFTLRFLCADEKEYEGPCVSLKVPLSDGSAGILADHANMVAALVNGELTFDTGERQEIYAVSDGLLEIKNGEVTILAYSAERPNEIDENRAREAAERARARLRRRMSGLEYRQSQVALSRALNRLRVKKGH
ncbi:MAG: ATP synthase F1 subunit epsilon [Parasporobacterium sp.]|nr:ATP synthase F1 subunit epsilon [Parasporobacterium sp.]